MKIKGLCLMCLFIWETNSPSDFIMAMNQPITEHKIANFINSKFEPDKNSVNEAVQNFNNILIEAAKQSLKLKKCYTRSKKRTHQKWFNLDCKQAKMQMQYVASYFNKFPNNRKIRECFYKTKNCYRKVIKTSKKQFKENMLKQIESLKSNNSDDYWKILNELKGKDKNTNSNNIEGKVWEEYFKKLLTPKVGTEKNC